MYFFTDNCQFFMVLPGKIPGSYDFVPQGDKIACYVGTTPKIHFEGKRSDKKLWHKKTGLEKSKFDWVCLFRQSCRDNGYRWHLSARWLSTVNANSHPRSWCLICQFLSILMAKFRPFWPLPRRLLLQGANLRCTNAACCGIHYATSSLCACLLQIIWGD